MAEPAWLGYGGLAASALSAIAAYLAIRQTVIQRKISNKAQIITKDIKIKIEKINIDKSKTVNNFAFNALSNQQTPTLPVLNVGLGPALKFKYQWIFDYEKNLTLNGFRKLDSEYDYQAKEYNSAIRANEYCYQIENKDYTYITILGHNKSRWYYQEEKYSDVVYILPWSVNKEEVNLTIPPLIPMLLSNYLFNETTSHDLWLDTITGPHLIIEYEEISGTVKKEIFASKYKLNEFTLRRDTLEATFSLVFSPSLSWTALVIQRLRKRYEKWKTELI